MRGSKASLAGAVAFVAAVLFAGCAQTPATPSPVASREDAAGTPAPAQPAGSPATPPSTFTGETVSDPAAPAVPEDSPTADDLILADVAAGKVDPQTGLLYRVYATFGDPRLPGEYASAPPTETSPALAEAAIGLDSLQAPDELVPFLVRPTDPRSVFHGPATTSAGDTIRTAGYVPAVDPGCEATGWTFLQSTTQPVKVWARCDDPRLAGVLADTLAATEELSVDIAEIMGPATPDTGGPDGGGDSSIDVYVTAGCVTRGGSCRGLGAGAAAHAVPVAPFSDRPAWKSSAYVLLGRRYADDRTDLRAVLAHELFHVYQMAHNFGGLVEGGKWHWFGEASAKWAEEYFVPESRPKWVYPHFQGYQATALGMTSVSGKNAYSSFIWPYFMDQEARPSSIAATWRALEGKVGWDAANTAMASVFSFEDHFKDFAVRAWNFQAPAGIGDAITPPFQNLDHDLPRIPPGWEQKQVAFRALPARSKSDPPIEVSVDIPPLAQRYHLMSVGDDIAKLVIDFGDVQPSGALTVEGLIHLRGQTGWERRSLSTGKTTFCLDREGQDVDGLILVIADHSWAPKDALTGKYRIQSLAVPCEDGTYTIELNGDMPGAGHYEGEGDIECDRSLDGTWGAAATFPNEPGIVGFTISDTFMSISPFGTSPQAGANWYVIPSTGGRITMQVDENARPVTITATGHADAFRADLSITLTCAQVVRADSDEQLP